MLAIEIHDPGPKGRLVAAERPRPRPGGKELTIGVAAAGVNRPDLLQRRGLYPPPAGASDIPGLEVAGVVLDRGPEASEWAVGDRVMALLAGGGYAEVAVAPAGQCLAVPDGLSPAEAATLPEGLFTVFANLFELGRLEAGESLLIHGGSSGIGTLAIKMAKLAGARVFTTSRSEEKRRACQALGADRAILAPSEDFERVILDETEGRGVDVVLDMVGGSYFAKNLACLAVEGRHLSIAFLGGKDVELDLFTVMQKRLAISGSTLRARSVAEKTRLRDAISARFGPDLAAGRLRPVLAGTLPLRDAARAHELLEAGEIVGKLALRPESLASRDWPDPAGGPSHDP